MEGCGSRKGPTCFFERLKKDMSLLIVVVGEGGGEAGRGPELNLERLKNNISLLFWVVAEGGEAGEGLQNTLALVEPATPGPMLLAQVSLHVPKGRARHANEVLGSLTLDAAEEVGAQLLKRREAIVLELFLEQWEPEVVAP